MNRNHNIPDNYVALMNGWIDGVLNEAQQTELDQYLADHPEANRYFQELREAVGLFDRVEALAPPSDLHDRILAAVDTEDQSVRPPSLSAILRGSLRYSHAFALAAGLVLGFIAFDWLASRGLDHRRDGLELLYGAQISPDLLDESQTLETVELEADGVTGEIRPRLLGDRMLLQLDLESERDVTLVFGFEEPTTCTGFRLSDRRDYQVSAEPGQISMQGEGDCGCEFLLEGVDPEDGPIRMVLSAGDSVLVEENISPWQ